MPSTFRRSCMSSPCHCCWWVNTRFSSGKMTRWNTLGFKLITLIHGTLKEQTKNWFSRFVTSDKHEKLKSRPIWRTIYQWFVNRCNSPLEMTSDTKRLSCTLSDCLPPIWPKPWNTKRMQNRSCNPLSSQSWKAHHPSWEQWPAGFTDNSETSRLRTRPTFNKYLIVFTKTYCIQTCLYE